jgi:cell division protein FtsL
MTDDEIGTLWAERNALEAIVTNLRAERDAQHATYTALHDALIVAEGQRDQLRAERDALRNEWSGLLIEQARLMALRDEAIAERDALRKELAKLPILDGALIIPCKALAVQS